MEGSRRKVYEVCLQHTVLSGAMLSVPGGHSRPWDRAVCSGRVHMWPLFYFRTAQGPKVAVQVIQRCQSEAIGLFQLKSKSPSLKEREKNLSQNQKACGEVAEPVQWDRSTDAALPPQAAHAQATARRCGL